MNINRRWGGFETRRQGSGECLTDVYPDTIIVFTSGMEVGNDLIAAGQWRL
jgi:hypothetical protein